MPKKIEMVGKRFGRLLVKEEAGRDKHGFVLWRCLCVCGDIKVYLGISLRSGNTKSCGCLSKEIAKKTHTTHGMSRTPEYNSWDSMVQRCNNPNNDNYNNYGGRGISVCKKWLTFTNFLNDMGKRPKGLTIDRINTNGKYCKNNCRWATKSTQSRNSRLDKRNKTGVNGIFWSNRLQKHIASIRVNNKSKHIGCYETIEEASIARKKAEQKYWGESDGL